MYNYKYVLLSEYLNDLFPNTVSENTPYNLRNGTNFVTLPSELDADIRESTTLSSFKYKLKKMFNPPNVPKFYLNGERFSTVHHIRIRNKCSNLNNDLFSNNLNENPVCQCNNGIEDAEHFFVKRNRFTNERIQLFRNTRKFHPISLDKLLFGADNLSDGENQTIFTEVQRFLRNTGRFQQ